MDQTHGLEVYEQAKSLLTQAEDGNFFWKQKRKGTRKDKLAGTKHKTGYVTIYVNGNVVLAHRLSWYFATGLIPKKDIDHIDGDKSNNKFSNLREVEVYQNQQNMKKPITNTTGYKGVYRNTGRGKPYCAQVKCMGVKYHLGRFDTAEEAKMAYDKKAKELHGDFYRYE